MNNKTIRAITGKEEFTSDMRQHFNKLEEERQAKKRKKFNTNYEWIMAECYK